MRKDKPSRTAYKVAMNILTLGVKPGMDQYFPPGVLEATADLLVASGAAGKRSVQWARSKRMLAIYEALDWMLPGQFEAFAQRKAFCEHQVREGIALGASQILVLGAGYDTLGWRLSPEFPRVKFFEIDHPATAALKAKGVDAMGTRGNLFLLAEDLGKHDLIDVLTENPNWDRNARSVIIAEGLIMYLTPESVKSLFGQCAASVEVGSRIAFSYIPTGVDGRPDAGPRTGLMLWLQKAGGEPWLWSIEPEALGLYLEECGWIIDPGQKWAARKYGVEYFIMAAKPGNEEQHNE